MRKEFRSPNSTRKCWNCKTGRRYLNSNLRPHSCMWV